jgi:hypothetical protein
MAGISRNMASHQIFLNWALYPRFSNCNIPSFPSTKWVRRNAAIMGPIPGRYFERMRRYSGISMIPRACKVRGSSSSQVNPQAIRKYHQIFAESFFLNSIPDE